MASVWKHPNSKYWTACFTDRDGRRRKKSTKEINRKNALRLADKLEEVHRTRISEATARKLLSEAVSRQLGERIATSTLRQFTEDFLRRKKLEVSNGTLELYSAVLNKLVRFLGNKADEELQFITRADLERFRDAQAERLSANSVNLAVKIVRMFFKAGMERDLLDANSADSLGTIKSSNKITRRSFTLEEIRSLLKVVNQEWRGIILFGLYTGQRLGDIVSLTWADLDLQENQVAINTRKTGRRIILPLVGALNNYLSEIPSSDDPNAAIFPSANQSFLKLGKVVALSAQFHKIMVDAGLVKKQSRAKKNDSQDRRREVKKISFHSLRHTATSLLKNAGVSDVVARDLIGHESVAVSASYTHIDMDTKRSALGKLPEIG